MNENENENVANAIDASSDTSKANLRDVWNAIDTPIYCVIDEEGVNVAEGQIRRLDRSTWVYNDNTDGFRLMSDDDAARLILVPEKKHVAYGWDRNGNVVKM